MTQPPRSLLPCAAILSALLLLGAAACGGVEEPARADTTDAAAATAVVSVVDLGTLPGGTRSTATAINNLGQIAGTAVDATATQQIVVWRGGVISPIAAVAGAMPPSAINDLGEVVSYTSSNDGIYWDPSGAASLLPPIPGGIYSPARGINNAGLIPGSSFLPLGLQGEGHAGLWNRTTFLRDLGQMNVVPSWAQPTAEARGVNDLGEVVGIASAADGLGRRHFLWRNGTFTDLGPAGGFEPDRRMLINNCGLIAGNESDGVQAFPWAWQSGVRTPLPGLAGQVPAYGYHVHGINNAGDLVGSRLSVSLPGTFGNFPIAVLWRAGQAIDLGVFPGGAYSSASDINDSGEIVGSGSLLPTGTVEHALLWNAGIAGGLTTPTVTLAATTSTSIRTNRSVSFRGTFADPDCGPWKYTFDWGNGTTSGTAASPGAITGSRTYPRSGKYRVVLKVTDANGASGVSTSIQVSVR